MIDINIDYNICRGIDCLDCLDICPMNIFDVKDNKLIISNLTNCCRCGVCMDVCSYNAISFSY